MREKNAVKIHICDIDIYTSEIQRLSQEYIETLHDGKLIYSQNKMYFNGMLKYVYNNFFKHNPIDTSDIDLLENIWLQYTDLCYTYGKKPSICWFSFFSGIKYDTIMGWLDGDYRTTDYIDENGDSINRYTGWKTDKPTDGIVIEKSNLTYTEISQKWLKECEAVLCDGVTDQNSIGSMFLLKSKYGYRETAPIPAPESRQVTISAADLPKLSQLDIKMPEVSQIAENHAQK